MIVLVVNATVPGKMEDDLPPTPNQRVKEKKHKSSYIHVPTFCSLL